jgi:hypothetical protein
MPYFDDTLTLDEAKQIYRRLARTFHPDVNGGNDEQFKALGAEYEAFKLRMETPMIAVAAPAANADPMAWFAAVKAAAQAAAAAPLENLRRTTAQAMAHAAATTAAAGASSAPPPTSPAASPPRPRRPRVARVSTPSAQPRQTTAQRIAEKEEKDYQEARWASKDKFGHRRYGDVVIFWEDATWDRIECVAILTASNPRHEIRRNGVVVYSEPATRKWQMERKAVIERARRMV